MALTVRYVYEKKGIIVRKTAAGDLKTYLNYEDVVIYDPNDAPVTKPLNGTTYTWIKITYYHSGENDDDSATPSYVDTGWIARENTYTVAVGTPNKSAVRVKDVGGWTDNGTQKERFTNARYIFNYLTTKLGWSTNAACAILGNMEAESGLNPGNWQSYHDLGQGYGLVHWSPADEQFTSNLSAGEEKSDVDVQLKYIQHQVDNGLQWQSWRHTPQMAFDKFTTSPKSVQVLAEYFLRCYERPGDIAGTLPDRKRSAQKWYDLLDAIGAIK